MRLDGPDFARALLAVSAAMTTDKFMPWFKCISIEVYDTGVRLCATDRSLVLLAWVPDVDYYYDGEPEFDEQPERVVVASDKDGRGRGLAGYVLALAGRLDTTDDDYVPGQLAVDLDFDVRLPAGATPLAQDALEGMEPTFATLSVTDVEKVYLEAVPINYPDWRAALSSHHAAKASALRLNPETLERLAKVRKHARGALVWSLGGKGKAAMIHFAESSPFVYGLITQAIDEDQQGPTEADNGGAPGSGGLDLRTATGLVTVGVTNTGIVKINGDTATPDVIDCPDSACDYFVDGSEDGDAALSDLVNHLASKHGEHDKDRALRLIHGLPVDPAPDAPVDVELLGRAAELVISTQFGSGSMLKRKLVIGTEKAADLIAQLEEHGVIGPQDGTKAREVLVRPDQVDEVLRQIGATR